MLPKKSSILDNCGKITIGGKSGREILLVCTLLILRIQKNIIIGENHND
jgi:hypothetical protein